MSEEKKTTKKKVVRKKVAKKIEGNEPIIKPIEPVNEEYWCQAFYEGFGKGLVYNLAKEDAEFFYMKTKDSEIGIPKKVFPLVFKKKVK